MQFILIDQNTKRHFLDNILDCIQKIDIATMKSPNVLKKIAMFFLNHTTWVWDGFRCVTGWHHTLPG